MRSDVYLEMAAVQERHWWFATRQLDGGANLARARLLLTGILAWNAMCCETGSFPSAHR